MSGGRIVGLSRHQKPAQLHSVVGNKPRPNKVPKAVDDPPVSSDEEAGNEAVTDNHGGASNGKKKTAAGNDPESDRRRDAVLDSSGSSGDERAARAMISPTNFGKAAQTSNLPRGLRRKSDDIESLGSETEPASSKRRRPNDKTGKAVYKIPSSSGGHLTDEHGFTKMKSSKTTYGKKNTSSKEQAEKKGSTSDTMTRRLSEANQDATAATASESKLKLPAPFDSPEKSKSSKLRLPKGLAPSSPEAKSFLQTKGFKPQGIPIKGPIRRVKKPIEVPKSPSPPPAVFKLPAQISELAHAGDDNDQPDGELSGILSDAESGGRPSDVEAIDAGQEPAAAATVCPWCGEPVDKALLDESSKGKRMNVRQQTRFCQKHRKQTAVEIWQANGYPQVDWQGLDKRFAEHHTLLLDIVNGRSSHFRSILGEKIQSGQARSMKKEDNLNPGYYGPRGFNVMCDYLVNEFGDLLKEKAVDDRVIAGRGSAAFIQSVLVAELAVQLIKDDMRVSVEEARDIMEASKALGEMVHEEV
ncbi:Uncharacterized protein TPAR_03122 [Tolypocladium paradoxum]|uniref:Restriction of telomere capping protein 4 n=1 Tax=Tolypocladium paradoxum TaxID=94208 RepID=A0A2S4L2L6_9HYPO|nr:Uncharacterized protein TPAR_03122 [Tolypocladium paradoxum]